MYLRSKQNWGSAESLAWLWVSRHFRW